MTEEICNTLNVPNMTIEQAVSTLESLPSGIVPNLVARLVGFLNNPALDIIEFNATWNAESSCRNACPNARYTTAF